MWLVVELHNHLFTSSKTETFFPLRNIKTFKRNSKPFFRPALDCGNCKNASAAFKPPPPLPRRQRTLVLLEHKAGWAPKPVSILWRKNVISPTITGIIFCILLYSVLHLYFSLCWLSCNLPFVFPHNTQHKYSCSRRNSKRLVSDPPLEPWTV